ncbi:MAG TPA: tyrosine-type recombinase/integrase [Polyangiaceae bacterium]|nr:tyrosine-type recombinase/integrase [Polyangiaceae bacterium]
MPREQKGQPPAKIRTKGAGSPQWRGDHRWVRVSLPDGTRPWYRLCKFPDGTCTCHEMSDARAEETAAAVSERERERVRTELAAIKKAEREKKLTVRQFGERWTSGELYNLHGEVNALRPKASAKTDGYRLKAYVYPDLGDHAIADVTEQDIESVMAKAERTAREKYGRPWRKASRFQLYQCLRRLFDLAIRPGRLRADSPVSDYLRPGRDAQKLFGFLYPSELIALLGCRDVAIERRVLYALAVYTGLRKGSLYALKWCDVDFQHRTLTSLKSKTGLPQLFEVPETLTDLLKAWHTYNGGPKGHLPLVPRLPSKHREAHVLRQDLKAAKIQRASLFGGPDNVEPLRFHDLRATFVTWAMREGRGDGWISDRTGHLTPEMRARYARAARTLSDLDYQPFPGIAKAIPELAELPANVVPLRRSGK